MFEKLKERLHVTMLIREAIDTYPDGICFAAAGGRPILSNRKINDICYRLTGHTITNADRMWEELEGLRSFGGAGDALLPDRMGEALSPDGVGKVSSPDGVEQILCFLQDGQVWQFQRRRLCLDFGAVTQYEAADVSELYRYQAEQREKNKQLSDALERQRALLQGIVETNVKKELLQTKMRIHADFGKLLVMTRSRLLAADEKNVLDADGAGDLSARVLAADAVGDDSAIFQAWDNLITDMENASMAEEVVAVSPQVELRKIAALIGCSIELTGEEPKERKALLLLYAAIREALTNAVRHAGADRLIVDIRHRQGCCEATISSNGRRDVTSIREGGGLGDLRRRLEQEGGTLRMEVNANEGVVMHVTILEGEN